MLASGLLELAIATGEVRYAEAARALVDASLAAGDELPGDEQAGDVQTGEASANAGRFGVPDGADPVLESQGLAVQPDPSDGALPSGLSAVASAAHRLFLLTAHERYRAAASTAMAGVADAAIRQPISLGAALTVMSALAEPSRQVVVIGDDPMDAATTLARQWHRSGSISLALTRAQSAQWAAAGFELLQGRAGTAGVTTAWVCTDLVCALPTTDAAELELQLGRD